MLLLIPFVPQSTKLAERKDMKDDDSSGFYLLAIFFMVLFPLLVPFAWSPAERPPVWLWALMAIASIVMLFLVVTSTKGSTTIGGDECESATDEYPQIGQIRLIVDNTVGKQNE